MLVHVQYVLWSCGESICIPLASPLLSLYLYAETFYIVVEFASVGSLLSVLKEKRHRGALLPWQTRLDYGLQIAEGMTYLASKQVYIYIHSAAPGEALYILDVMLSVTMLCCLGDLLWLSAKHTYLPLVMPLRER